MAKKGTNKISPNELKLREGIDLIKEHPLFSRLNWYERIVDGKQMGKSAARVDSHGYIWLNKDCPLSPQQWLYVIAHCQLHLAFGHFDAERMPAYENLLSDGTTERKVSVNQRLWNYACDIYIAKFLSDIKLGRPLNTTPINEFPGPLTDELRIYKRLVEAGCPDNFYFGTASDTDMIGLEKPLTYRDGQKNAFVSRFAYALAYSVTSVVSEAAGIAIDDKKATPAVLAARWFVNHYPLLGALASSFKIIEDANLCIREEIQIAAVNVVDCEIYVNPAAGLDQDELRFVLAHEFLHAGLCHHERCRGRDPYLWNVACDYVINGWLHDMEVGHIPESCLYDETLKNLSAEALYDIIVEDLKKFSKLQTLRGYCKGDIMGSPKPGYTTNLDDFYRSALQNGLEYHLSTQRGFVPAGLVEEIRALSMPPIPWDVQLAEWFESHFESIEKHRSYARPSRRQGSTPDIPRPSYVRPELPEFSRTYGVIIDTSGSMSAEMIGYALGAVASFSAAREVPFARVVFCDAAPYDAGYLSPEDIAGRVKVKGRGGTVLQPAVDLLENAKDFPKDAPILMITDGGIESRIHIRREHAWLLPDGFRLPFAPKGKVFSFSR